MRQLLRIPWFRWFLIGLFIIITILLPQKFIKWRYNPDIYSVEDVPQGKTAIVFGAGLWRDGRATPVLADRVTMAARLYNDGKVTQVLFSGSTQPPNYDEPAAMVDLALQLGVPPEDILIDSEGNRTYDTCLRAHKLFAVDNAILVSQRFHLPRALAICSGLGIKATGVSADLRSYRGLPFWQLREIPASFAALWDVYITPTPEPDLKSSTLDQQALGE
ncbi:MAG: hypothetical protein GTO18_09560 [Anaerolineales bacterium]|nr:hypothetical protein [Anaerolineales bacterium]